MKKTIILSIAGAVMALAAQPAMAEVDAAKIFKSKCTMCHSIDAKKTGPAIKDMNTDTAVLKDALTNGRKMMPKFGGKLSAEEIDAMVAFVVSNHAK